MTSVSTLFRKARTTKNPALAAKYRKEAAALRRKEGGRAAPKPKRKAKPKGNGSDTASIAPFSGYEHGAMQPGDVTDWQLEQILDGTSAKRRYAAGDQIRRLVSEAAQSARRELEATHVEQIQLMRELNQINVVSGFIAEMEGLCAANDGSLPAAVVLSGTTLARVVQQLRDDGFTADGRKGYDRKAIRKAT
jgi:hypothetical protein